MRRVTTTLFVIVAQLVFMASGQQVAYSEAVPAELIVAQDTAAALDNAQKTAEKQSESSTRQPVTTVAAAKPAVHTASVTQGDKLMIPSIGFAAPVVNVGVTATNNIDVPAGMQVGRWVGGAEPGKQGAVFLDGHVDGVFARLSGVTIGQIVSVSYGGQVYIYRVVHMETIALEGIDMRRALSVYGGASEGLNMMTCAGTFVPSMDTYDQRLVVYAVRV